ncbi:MAG: Uncharacterised protein [Glaciecola sp. HTCC2999]|jgi:hypothetical protein|nr:MAG: Uncharacterised protein [Glaciecola sp. HTCC2999]
MKFTTKLAASAVLLGLASQANAAVTLVKTDDTTVSIGGYVKADLRHVSGDLAYRDFWIGNNPGAVDTSQTKLNIKESRLQFKVQHDDVTGVIELDFYGSGGNEIISNSTGPRIRHAFIKYNEWTIGQTWSTFMPLHALSETLDFGGPHVGEVFIRQSQIRYSKGGWSFAVENPETFGSSDSTKESVPDFVGRYDHKGDWGQISVAGLVRQLDQNGVDETAVAGNIAAKFLLSGKDDVRVQLSVGEFGRYAGTTAVADIAANDQDETKVEDGLAYTVSYRHFWNDSTRSTVFYGNGQSNLADNDRSHWGVNLITNITPKLKYGVELGEYKVEDQDLNLSSAYFQLSAQFAF